MLMRFLKKLTLIAFLVFLAGAAWAAVYAYDKGFTKKWRRLVDNEFRKHGIEASIGKLTLDPFQGLVARDVKFYQDESRTSLLAAVSRIALDVDLIRLLEKELFFLNTIDIRNANVSLPIDPEDPMSERLEIQNFNARVLIPDNRIEISQAHGNLQGVEVVVRASLLQPAALETGGTGDAKKRKIGFAKERRRILDKTVKEMSKLAFARNERPKINIELYGDLDDVRNLRGRMSLEATNLKRGNYVCDELRAVLEFANSRAVLKELLVKDDKGRLIAQGEHVFGSGAISFNLQSSLDLHGLVSSAYENPSLGEIVFYDSPEINLEGEFVLDGEPIAKDRLPVNCVGSVRCGKFISRGIIFDGVEADFSINRDRFYCRNIKLNHSTGTLTANALFDTNGLRYDAIVRLDPAVAIPFSKSEGTRKFLGKCEFNEDSTFYLTLHGTGTQFKMNTWHSYGEIDARNVRFNGVPLRHIQADLEFDRRQQYYRNIRVQRDEGTVAAGFVSYHLDTKIATVEDAGGTVYPAELTRCFSPNIAKSLEAYRFSQAPTVSVSGTLDTKGKTKTDFRTKFIAQHKVDYDFLGKTITFDKAVADLRFTENKIASAHIEGDVFDGKLITDFSISDLSGARNYTAKVDVKSLSFRDLALRYGYHQDTEGELTGYFNFAGAGSNQRSITGKGVGIIVNGDVFAIPIFGPLSKLVSDIFAKQKAGYSVAREANFNFTMNDGIIATNDFEALANSFRLTGSGIVDTNSDSILFDARMNARGPTGLLLLPVSKLFEYQCEGSLSNPVWRPKILSGSPNSKNRR